MAGWRRSGEGWADDLAKRCVGQPFEADDLHLNPVHGDFDFSWQGVVVEEDGTFEADQLGPGTYDLTGCTLDGRLGIVAGITVGEGGRAEGVEVRLVPAGFLTLHYTGPSQYGDFNVFHGTTNVASDGIHTGTSCEHPVPPGSVRVAMRIRDIEQEKLVEVVAGGRHRVEFQFD